VEIQPGRLGPDCSQRLDGLLRRRTRWASDLSRNTSAVVDVTHVRIGFLVLRLLTEIIRVRIFNVKTLNSGNAVIKTASRPLMRYNRRNFGIDEISGCPA